MYCRQCEQTMGHDACTAVGVCGKDEETAALQDLLTFAIRGLAHYGAAGRAVGVIDADTDRFVLKALFSTLTNVNFDPDRLAALVQETVSRRKALADKVAAAGGPSTFADPAASFEPAAGVDGMIAQGEDVGLPIDRNADADTQSLQEITLYGIRGIAAYADHAAILGQEDPAVYGYVYEALSRLTDKDVALNDWIGLALKAGEVNLTAMQLLDAGNTGSFGHPQPTEVSLGHKAGKAILVSGHDLEDLADLLAQTEGTGINVYTHGEMLPAHAYPELKKYSHLVGHFGTAWQNQQQEFATFPGAILMTTNCIQEPGAAYRKSIFTTGNVGWAGVTHVANGDFGPVIAKAQEMSGFAVEKQANSVWVGYMHNAVLQDHPMGRVADTVVEWVKQGKIRHFFLVGGCDGAKPGRSYYTDFVEHAPDDTVILTLACGKFRFFDKDLGAIDGVPRLLDVGQCNDAYSAIQIAVALAQAFDTDVNSLPLSLVLSWYEQKAVAILLTLLHLGIKGIRLGPTLPTFVTPNVLNVLVENFDIKPISGTAEEDLQAILAA
jgi:hydroxylamine reductase